MTVLTAVTRRNYDSRVAMAQLAEHNAGVARARYAAESRRCQICGQWRRVLTEEVGQIRTGRATAAGCITDYQASKPGPCASPACCEVYASLISAPSHLSGIPNAAATAGAGNPPAVPSDPRVGRAVPPAPVRRVHHP